MNRAQALLAEALDFAHGSGRGQLTVDCAAPKCRAWRQLPGLTQPQAERQLAREGWARSPAGGWLCRWHAHDHDARRQDDLFAGGRAGP